MFAGITQSVQPIISAVVKNRCCTVRIKTPRGWRLALGASVSVDGICSTVARQGKDFFEVAYMPETLKKTTASSFAKGTSLNLERSLKLSDYVDGHFVAGHVDAVARVASFKKTGDAAVLVLELPKQIRAGVVVRGSIAINGVSLTVAHKSEGSIKVALIPYTLMHTNMSSLQKGTFVNVETDMMIRLKVAARESGGRVKCNATKRIRAKRLPRGRR